MTTWGAFSVGMAVGITIMAVLAFVIVSWWTNGRK